MILRDAIHPQTFPTVGHIVATRFNLRMFRDRRDLSKHDVYRRWITHRINQFYEVCLPSLLEQRMKPDLWLIGMDALDKESVGDVIEAIKPHRWIKPVWQEPNDSDLAPFSRALGSEAGKFDAVATTRVDNDDALALDYIAELDGYIQSAFAADHALMDFWVAFPSGAKLVEGGFYHYMHSTPHFLTRVTRGMPPEEHVLTINHSHLYGKGRKVFTPLTSHPMWLQNVHGENLSNRASAGALEFTPQRRVAELFGLKTISGPG